MSRETDQTLVMLSTVAGCIQTLLDTHAFARVDIQKRLQAGFNATRKAIANWPGFCNHEWVRLNRAIFTDYIMQMPDSGYSSAAIVKMMDRALIDLLERDSGLQRKTALLEPIHAAVRAVDGFCDRDGANFPAYEKSDQLLDELYRIIGFKVDVVG